MGKQQIEQIIKDLARDNFNLYSEQYELKNGLATSEATETAQDLAINYYDNRTNEEIERDEDENITQIDYVNFVMAEFETWVQKQFS